MYYLQYLPNFLLFSSKYLSCLKCWSWKNFFVCLLVYNLNQSVKFPLKREMLLKSASHLLKKFVLFGWKPFKNDEIFFLFHIKSFFCSRDIYVFVTTFRSCTKNSLIRKIRLISKFMTSKPGLQTIPIHILPNISQSKSNQTMKFGQLI